MKKIFIALAAAVTFAACSDDEPAAWKKLPTAPISGEQATLTVNDEPNTSGSVTLTAKSATQGTLLLENVLPGYAAIEMDVTLAERPDGTFDITGGKGLTTPPAMITKADAEPVIFRISATGNITPDGTAAIALTSVLSKEAQGGLTGAWNLLTNLKVDDMGTPVELPLWIEWSAKNTEEPNAEQTAQSLRTFGSSLVYQFLHSVTFSEDGNITAEYWQGNEDFNIVDALFGGIGYIGDWFDGYTGAYMINMHEQDPWLKSPKNLAFWYVKGEYLYVVPNIAAIIAQVGEDGGSDVSGGLDGLADIVASLGEYGIDVNALLPLVMQWMETGIPLKYEKTDNGLKLYADKEMCRPIIEALLPALPKLDEMIAKLVDENPNDEMIQMLPMLSILLGIENFAALDPIWKNNTDRFEISLNFEK